MVLDLRINDLLDSIRISTNCLCELHKALFVLKDTDDKDELNSAYQWIENLRDSINEHNKIINRVLSEL